MNSLFNSFPKERPPLAGAYRAIYEQEYLINRSSGSLANKIAAWLEAWMHRKVADASTRDSESLLEIGAGTLNHVRWEKRVANYDVVEPSRFLMDREIEAALQGSVYTSLEEIDLCPRYDRIVSIAVLEHLCDLPSQVASSALLMKDGGLFCAGIPSEGGLLWEWAWRYGTGPSFKRRTGLDYEPLMRHEHVNTADEIIRVICYFFESVEVSRFPLPLKHGSLYAYIEAKSPDLDRCKNYLSSMNLDKDPTC